MENYPYHLTHTLVRRLTLDLSSLTGTSLELRSCYRNLDQGSSLAKYGVDSMMHHQLNKLTDLTPDPLLYLKWHTATQAY